ncbi:MAG TPA: hypothetical protein VFO39_04175 [Candidatus Sulfotelmatobacter sp.]|nr:hypothetical protein [Candidatus Sulfotelmatobacter sp.]
MEALTRLVSESLARHGFDRPLDYRRLHWSRWFRCESAHSLLSVPSKPGVFAIAEEIMDMGPGTSHAGTAAQGCPAEQTSAVEVPEAGSRKAEAGTRRMLAVVQFCEADDMAYVLDRMFFRQNPLRSQFAAGRCFLRHVVIEDQIQRRGICMALNQWLASSADRATGIGAHFASSLELTAEAGGTGVPRFSPPLREVGMASSGLHANAATRSSKSEANIRCPSPFPSGF